MRQILVVLFTVLLFGCFSSKKNEIPSNKSQDNFGKDVVVALKNHDSISYKKLFVNKTQLEASIEKSVLSDEDKNTQMKRVDGRMKEIIKSISPSFKAINKSIKSNGIESKNIEFSRIESTSNQKNGITEGTLTIYFKYDGVEYKIKSEKCLVTKKGWRLLLPLKFAG